MDEQLVTLVRQLDREGRSVKAIARTLQIPVADVVTQLNDDTRRTTARPGEPRCWVNAGFSRSLDLTHVPQWAGLDPGSADAKEVSGLVAVLVAADHPRTSKAQVVGFLLDVWCLGIKSALPPEAMTAGGLAAFRHTYFQAFDAHVPVPADLARHLVFGAAAYAHDLGFDPDPDFGDTAPVLGEPTGPCPIRFGRDGKPFYLNGPYDNPGKILATLQAAVGKDGFGHTLVFPELPYY